MTDRGWQLVIGAAIVLMALNTLLLIVVVVSA